MSFLRKSPSNFYKDSKPREYHGLKTRASTSTPNISHLTHSRITNLVPLKILSRILYSVHIYLNVNAQILDHKVIKNSRQYRNKDYIMTIIKLIKISTIHVYECKNIVKLMLTVKHDLISFNEVIKQHIVEDHIC